MTDPTEGVTRARDDDDRIQAEILALDGGNDPFVAAVRATRMPMIITNPRLADNPVVFANNAFCRLTGYAREEIIGRNCRFLQGPETNPDVVARIRAAVEAVRPIEIDIRNHRKNGEPFWNRLLMAPVFDAAGALAFFFASQVDVTLERERLAGLESSNAALSAEIVDRSRAQEEGEARLRFAALAGRLGIWEVDLTTRALEASPIFRDNFGVPRDGIVTVEMVNAAVHPDDRARYDAATEASIRGGDDYDLEFRVQRPDGIAWVQSRAQVVRAGDGTPLRMAGISLDVTERKLAEERLALSEESVRLATDAAEIGTWDLDVAADVLTWSPRTKAMFGILSDDPVSMADFYAGLHPDDHEATVRAFATALDPAVRATYDVEYRTIGRDDGVVRWVAAKGKGLFDADGRCVRALGTAIDVTERKAAAERLRISEARLAESEAFAGLLLESTSEAFYSVDTDGVTTLCNTAFLTMLGFDDRRDVLGRRLHDVIHHSHPDGTPYPAGECPIYRAASQGIASHVADEVFFRQDGTSFPVDYRAEPIHRSGVLVGAICTFSDITARLAAERALQDLNRTLEQRVADRTRERDRTWANTQDLQAVIDGSGVFTAVNPAWTANLGWTAEEIVGTHHLSINHPDHLESSTAALNTALAGRLPPYESRLRHKDGSYRWFSWVATSEQDMVYASGRNITAEKEAAIQLEAAQDQLRQAQKMEAVGQLTGGIAHDFNNLLQIVVGNLEILQRGLPEDAGRLRRSAENAMTGARRAATLTQRLLAFSRRQPLAPRPVDVNALVSGMSDLIGRSLGETIALETVLGARLWRAEADPNQLESAILNLAVNARDAMPDGGKLTIETSNAHLDASYALANAEVRPGQYVLVCVSDTGSGMDKATMARVFEPFFTTKEVGKGTGLGLAMVYGFVKQSNGHVQLYSEPGEGTTVKIYLPRLVNPAADVEVAPSASIPEAATSEAILVVEDDDDVRASSVEILRDLGYRVVEAADGPTALDLLRQPGAERFSLLFTDVVLPRGMTGADLVVQARALHPGLPVLFTTGYARNAIVHQGRLDDGVELITKPFSYADLAARVRDVIDGGAR